MHKHEVVVGNLPLSAFDANKVKHKYQLNRKLRNYRSARIHEKHQNQIKSSLYSRYYAEACNEWRGPSPRLSAWATQLRRNVATVASPWRHCADLTGPGIEPQTSRTESVRLATELKAFLRIKTLRMSIPLQPQLIH